ncbi:MULTISPECIES: SDR family NAD(P)-dependent oxidoreductase [Agrobacterium]|uniref:SDR family NAD(P)-dependent oxidoreductase n=1 Tax=Agrobacterium tumefaciens TaxID=358 RepID=UPI0015748CD2|nr:SDR family oxidoreductase [Agrobacterium tumefaciens]NSZ09388.1 SDR family oxidoreductase [Agrobacterium tumefaciens]
MSKLQQTKDKTALVTGAAGGIGQVLTERLVAQGYKVLMLDINAQSLEACKARFGDAVTPVICDLTDRDSVAKARKEVGIAVRSLDVIVNNAGFIVPGPFIKAEADAIEKQMQINLLGPLRVLNTFLPLMVTNGHVVNVISMAGILPLKDSSVYAAGKFGLRGFTISLALELKERGIKVSGIYPSSVDTPMLQMEARNGGSPLNFLAEPLSPETVANAIMRAIREGKLEYYVPYGDGLLSRIVSAFPWSIARLLPRFEKKGMVGKQRYLAKIGKGIQ